MKVGKSFTFAQLIETLLRGGNIEKAAFAERFEITDDQFHRYISAAKRYMEAFHGEFEVAYLKSTNLYVLRKKKD